MQSKPDVSHEQDAATSNSSTVQGLVAVQSSAHVEAQRAAEFMSRNTRHPIRLNEIKVLNLSHKQSHQRIGGNFMGGWDHDEQAPTPGPDDHVPVATQSRAI